MSAPAPVTRAQIRLESSKRQSVEFAFDDSHFTARNLAENSLLNVPLSRILWVGISGLVIDVHLLVKNRGSFKLKTVSASFQGGDPNVLSTASNWVQSAMMAAYGGVKTQRRLLVVINPHGGPGKAVSLFKGKVEPILKAARCAYKVLYTKSNGHAQKIASEILPDEYDAIVSVSGDGTLHELINGLAQHKEPMRALRIPITPIPAGSGNGLCLNLLGIEEGLDVAYATLNAIKGRPMNIDLLSILQSGKRSISFMTQCGGLMADVDLGTEHLRWLGSNRFIYGFLRGVVTAKTYRFKISAKIDSRADKVAMVETSRKQPNSATDDKHPPAEVESLSTGLPPLQYVDDYEGWTTFEGPVLYFFAGKGPYVSRELMQFPVSAPNDGMVDLVIQGKISRAEMLKHLDGAEKGTAYWQDQAHYVKASAYRLGLLQEAGNLSIDGERFPFEDYYAEVHRGLGTVLSMNGRYVVNFALDPPRSA